MLNKLLMFLMVFLFSASIVSSEISFDGQKLNRGIKEEIAQTGINVPEPLSSEDKSFWDWFFNKPDSKIKEWTIMVFINAKNNLERFGLKDVNEMEAVGSSDKVNIVVEIGRMDGFDSSDGDWKGTRRYLVKKDNDTSKITSPVVEDLGKTDMGDWQSVAAFGKWAKAKYPAKKYMIVIWNHGSGWEKNIRGLITKGISYDDETGTHLTTPQLGMALRDMDGVDVYGSDACLMGMAEVVYEIKDYAKFIVGSEETEPGDGYTYDALLSPLIAGPAMTPEQFAKVAVDAYSDHYQSIGEGSTQSYVKSAAINGFLKVVNEFTYSASNAGEKELVKKAVGNAQSYAISDNKDLYHFVSLILKETKNADVTAKGNALMDFINKELVGHNRYTNGSAIGNIITFVEVTEFICKHWEPVEDHAYGGVIAPNETEQQRL
ncbi:MAG: hypothetical protein HY746_05540 [Elusimicrobia bacterium]|nr:hypothetical protein [Elusimicrobiota bacterium]